MRFDFRFVRCAPLCAAIIAAGLSAAGAQTLTTEQKLRVRVVMDTVARISAATKSLDAFGQSTFPQSREILNMGQGAVYPLSEYLSTDDWKVRFWIADMMGYLENPDAERPLLRLVRDERECKAVRDRAAKSLSKLRGASRKKLDKIE